MLKAAIVYTGRRRAMATCWPVWALAVILTGCNGAHLYNPAEHELAKKAESSFKDAKLSQSLEEERKLAEKMLARELEVVRRHVLARRDLTIVTLLLADTKVEDFQRKVGDRIVQLAGPAGQSDALVGMIAQLPTARQNVQLAEARYRVAYRAIVGGRKEPDLGKCPAQEDFPGLDDHKLVGLQDAYDRLETNRQTYQNVAMQINESNSGEFGALNTRIVNVEQELQKLESAIEHADIEYQDAKKRYDNELQSSQPPDVVQVARDLQDKLAALTRPAMQAQKVLAAAGVDDLGLSGAIKKLQAEYDNLNELLDAFVTGNGQAQPDSLPATKVRVRLAATLPSVFKEVGEALNYPQVGVLVLEANRLRIELESVRKRRQRAQTVLDLLRLKRDATGAELGLLRGVQTDLNGQDATKTIVSLIGDPADMLRHQRLASALLNYVNAWTVHRVAEEQADYMLIGLRHAAALDASESALAQWDNLVGEPITQLVALHGSGVKTQDLANLIQAAGLGAIGYGVNR
jgi:hypothetical protein